MPKPYTAKEAQAVLQVDRNKFYRLVDKHFIRTIAQPRSPQRLYDRESIDQLAIELQQFRDSIRSEEEEIDTTLIFRQATPKDMDGVYRVAHELFGHTTPAEQRKPMVAACPQGNYIVLRGGTEIVAYIHVLPLYPDVLDNFMKGKIRGWDITAKDLDCFAPGKEVECLVRSIGATLQYGEEEQRRFARCLLRGTIREMMNLAQHDILIRKLYATSSKGQGIRICYSADMTFYSKPLGDRLTFVVDVLTSTSPTFARYRAYLERSVADIS